MKRTREHSLVCTKSLIFQPSNGLVFDRRTYFDSRSLCFGKLFSVPEFLESPLEFREEWKYLADVWINICAKRASKKK